jgi:hypothetical protein
MIGLWLRRCTALPALAVFLVHTWLMHHAMMSHTGGAPSYPIDDAFIHLSLARHIVETGVLGVMPGVFASASSSIVWPWLLAALMRLFGSDATLPLWLNVAFGACVPFATDWVARRLGGDNLGAIRRTTLNLLVVVLGPLPTLALIGMEHTLHALLLVLFVAVAAMHIADTKRYRWLVVALAAAAVSTRYESLFAVGLATMFLLFRRELASAARVVVAGALPVVGFGLYSKLHGSYFLPVSVLLKGRPIEIKDPSDVVDMFGGDILHHLSQETHLLIAGTAAGWLLWRSTKERGFFTARSAALAIGLGSLLAHVELAGLGWFYRYDSYLVILLLTMVGIAVGSEAPRSTFQRMRTGTYWLAVAAGVFTFGPMLPRAIAAAKTTPSAGKNIFEQQVQTAKFLARHFPTDNVAINDVGAVTYYRDGPIVDLVGLVNVDVAKAKGFKLDTPMKPADMVRFTSGSTLAVIYDDWFANLIPGTWLRVARWTIPDNVSCAYATISIYAIRSDDVGRVVSAAREFAGKELPAEVMVSGYAAERAGDGVAAGDVVEVTADVDGKDSTTHAYAVEADGTAKVLGVGTVLLRGRADSSRVTVGKIQATLHVRLLRRHLPSVCVTGAVRQSVCLESVSSLSDAVAAADPLPSARPEDVHGWRDGDSGLTPVTRETLAVGLRDRDLVVVP